MNRLNIPTYPLVLNAPYLGALIGEAEDNNQDSLIHSTLGDQDYVIGFSPLHHGRSLFTSPQTEETTITKRYYQEGEGPSGQSYRIYRSGLYEPIGEISALEEKMDRYELQEILLQNNFPRLSTERVTLGGVQEEGDADLDYLHAPTGGPTLEGTLEGPISSRALLRLLVGHKGGLGGEGTLEITKPIEGTEGVEHLYSETFTMEENDPSSWGGSTHDFQLSRRLRTGEEVDVLFTLPLSGIGEDEELGGMSILRVERDLQIHMLPLPEGLCLWHLDQGGGRTQTRNRALDLKSTRKNGFWIQNEAPRTWISGTWGNRQLYIHLERSPQLSRERALTSGAGLIKTRFLEENWKGIPVFGEDPLNPEERDGIPLIEFS